MHRAQGTAHTAAAGQRQDQKHGSIIRSTSGIGIIGISSTEARKHRRRHQLEHRHGSMGDFKRTLSELNTYAIIMQSFRHFSMQLRCVSSKTKALFIILIFYRLSVFNALRPVCRKMNTVLAK